MEKLKIDFDYSKHTTELLEIQKKINDIITLINLKEINIREYNENTDFKEINGVVYTRQDILGDFKYKIIQIIEEFIETNKPLGEKTIHFNDIKNIISKY